MKRIVFPLVTLRLSLGVCLLFAASASAQKPACTLPLIVTKHWDGWDGWDGFAKEVAENGRLGLQKFPREQFARKDAPDEMFVLAERGSSCAFHWNGPPPATGLQAKCGGPRDNALRSRPSSSRADR